MPWWNDNLPPVLTVPIATINATQKVAMPVAGLAVSDPDAGSGNLSLTLMASNAIILVDMGVPGGISPTEVTFMSPDNDTYLNQWEFFTGADPESADAAGIFAPSVVGSNFIYAFPVSHRIDPNAYDVRYSIHPVRGRKDIPGRMAGQVHE